MTNVCVSKLTIIGSNNGLSPAIIRTNAGILLIRTWGINFSEILSQIHTFSFKKMHLKTSSAKLRQFYPGLNDPGPQCVHRKCGQILGTCYIYGHIVKKVSCFSYRHRQHGKFSHPDLWSLFALNLSGLWRLCVRLKVLTLKNTSMWDIRVDD